MKVGLFIGCVLFVLSANIILTDIIIDFKTSGIFHIEYIGMALVPLFGAILIVIVIFSKKSES